MREKSGKGKTIWVNSIFLSLIYSLFSYLLYHVFPYEVMTGELFLIKKTWNIPKTQMWSCLDHETRILLEQCLTHLIIILVLGMFESIPRCLESQKMLQDNKDIHGLVDMIKDMLCGMKMEMCCNILCALKTHKAQICGQLNHTPNPLGKILDFLEVGCST